MALITLCVLALTQAAVSALGRGGWCSAWCLSQLQTATWDLGWSLNALEGLLRPKCGVPYTRMVPQSSCSLAVVESQ